MLRCAVRGGMLTGSALSQLQSWDACALRSHRSCACDLDRSSRCVTPCLSGAALPPAAARGHGGVTGGHGAAAPLQLPGVARLPPLRSQLSLAPSCSPSRSRLRRCPRRPGPRGLRPCRAPATVAPRGLCAPARVPSRAGIVPAPAHGISVLLPVCVHGVPSSLADTFSLPLRCLLGV